MHGQDRLAALVWIDIDCRCDKLLAWAHTIGFNKRVFFFWTGTLQLIWQELSWGLHVTGSRMTRSLLPLTSWGAPCRNSTFTNKRLITYPHTHLFGFSSTSALFEGCKFTFPERGEALQKSPPLWESRNPPPSKWWPQSLNRCSGPGSSLRGCDTLGCWGDPAPAAEGEPRARR